MGALRRKVVHASGRVAAETGLPVFWHHDPAVRSGGAILDLFGECGVPAGRVILGPGALNNNVHGDNEFIYIDDLISATKIYAAMAMDWCGVADETH